MSAPGGLLPANYEKVWVRGQFIDLSGAPLRGTITFTASPAVLLDRASKHIIANKRFDSVLLDNTGKFAIELPATNDPDIIPTGWTYIVREPTGRQYNMTVPYNTPRLEAPGDPYDAERVIELIDIVPAPGANGGTVQLVKGRGIESVEIDQSGAMLLHYDDNTSSLPLPVAAGPDTVTNWAIRASGVVTNEGLTDDFGNDLYYKNSGGSAPAQVVFNRLDCDFADAGSAQVLNFNRQLGADVSKLGMSWSYSGIATGGAVVLAVWDQLELQYPNTINARCHLRLWPAGWSFDVFQNGTGSTVSSGTFSPALPASRVLWTEVTFAGDTAIVHLPNGQVQRLNDARIGNIHGTVAGWAFVKDGTPPVFDQAIYSMYAWRAKPWPLT